MTAGKPTAAALVALAELAAAEKSEQTDELTCAALDEGATLREVAAVLGVDESTVRRRYVTPERSNKGPRLDPDVDDQVLIDLRAEGLSFTEIAAAVGRSRGLVRGRLARYGAAANPHGARALK